jgi:16S rRNA processing protein RimM
MEHAEEQPQYVTIGEILKPCGIRGEVKVLPLTDIPGRFEQVPQVRVTSASAPPTTLEITHVRYYKHFVYLHFQGRNTVEDVRGLRGSVLQVERSTVPELPEGEFYYFEIIGSVVYTNDARYLGTVTDILETGAHDVYVVHDAEHEREYLIPATEEIVQHIDRRERRLTIQPLEGLLDL